MNNISDLYSQVSETQAVRACRKSILTKELVRVGVTFTALEKGDDVSFLQGVSSRVQVQLRDRGNRYLLAIATSSTLLLVGSEEESVQRAIAMASAKFVGRISLEDSQMQDDKTSWIGHISDLSSLSERGDVYDEAALWDVVRKASSQTLFDPMAPPEGSKSITQILAIARSKLLRLTPVEVYAELTDTSFPMTVCLVDIRPERQRRKEGKIEGCLVIERNVLEWRFDPRCEARLAIADRYDLRVVVFCSEGYTSSLAAAALQDLGLLNATDMIGGYKAWLAAGLPARIQEQSMLRAADERPPPGWQPPSTTWRTEDTLSSLTISSDINGLGLYSKR